MIRTTGKSWSRRSFLGAALCAPLVPGSRVRTGVARSLPINTVQGSVSAGDLGVTLIHEHVLVDFIGADQVRRDRYDPEEVIRVVLPHLLLIKDLGCGTFVDCTPAYLGRDPILLRRLAQASGVRLITNTGYYGAGGGKYVPRHAREEAAEKIAGRWVAEFRHGIEDTGIKPGFIKIGVNKGPLNPIDAKLVRSAALAHRETGMTIACHMGDGAAASEAVGILKEEGVAPAALIWVHAQGGDQEARSRLARAGVFIEIDGISDSTLPARVEQVKSLHLVGRVLTSLDAGWFQVGEPGGGKFKSYDYYFKTFLPALGRAGVSDETIRQMTAATPALALQPSVKRA